MSLKINPTLKAVARKNVWGGGGGGGGNLPIEHLHRMSNSLATATAAILVHSENLLRPGADPEKKEGGG